MSDKVRLEPSFCLQVVLEIFEGPVQVNFRRVDAVESEGLEAPLRLSPIVPSHHEVAAQVEENILDSGFDALLFEPGEVDLRHPVKGSS